MAIPQRTSQPGTFFVTTATFNRRRLFQQPTQAELFIDTLQHYRREGHYLLHDFVIMPDHVHLLLTPQNITLERAIQLIQGGFSHGVESKLPVSQRGFTDHRIRDREDFLARRRYIHDNPVVAGLVQFSGDDAYSSACKTPSAAEATSSPDPERHG